MRVLELLLHPGMLPFSVSIGVVFGMLIIELVMAQVGLSLLGGGDAELDIDTDIDIDIAAEPDFDLEMSEGIDTVLEADVRSYVRLASATVVLPWMISMTSALLRFAVHRLMSSATVSLIATFSTL